MRLMEQILNKITFHKIFYFIVKKDGSFPFKIIERLPVLNFFFFFFFFFCDQCGNLRKIDNFMAVVCICMFFARLRRFL